MLEDFIKLVLILICIVAIFSCSAIKKTTETSVIHNRDSIYIEKVDTFITPKDSAEIKALLKCNEYGQVVIDNLNLSQSKNAQLQFKLDSLGNLIAKFERPQTIINTTNKEVKIKDSKQGTKIITEVKYKYKTHWIYKILLGISGIVILILIAYLYFKDSFKLAIGFFKRIFRPRK